MAIWWNEDASTGSCPLSRHVPNIINHFMKSAEATGDTRLRGNLYSTLETVVTKYSNMNSKETHDRLADLPEIMHKLAKKTDGDNTKNDLEELRSGLLEVVIEKLGSTRYGANDLIVNACDEIMELLVVLLSSTA